MENKEKNNFIKNNEYRPAIRIMDFFNNVLSGEGEVKKTIGLFKKILNMVFFTFLYIVEKIIGVKLYTLSTDTIIPTVSLGVKKTIVNLSEKKVISKIIKEPRFYCDEPFIFSFATQLPPDSPDIGTKGSLTVCGGADLNEEKALMKTVGEAVERFCLLAYREEKFWINTHKKFLEKYLDPLSFVGISPEQRKDNPILEINKDSFFRWVKGFCIENGKTVFIPAQVVYSNYKYHPREPIIRSPITTGAAAADSLVEALYRGICEAVERDAFMITYLNKISPPVIEPSSIVDEEIQSLLNLFSRYNLETYLIDITTDIKIPSIMAIIIDRTGIGPAVHVSAKTDLDLRSAILGVLSEGLKGRLAFRRRLDMIKPFEERKRELNISSKKIMTFDDRAIFWYSPDMIEKIEFIFSGKKKLLTEDSFKKQTLSSFEKIKTVIKILKNKNILAYGIDVTIPKVKEEGIYVVKAILPKLQPLYLDEGLKYTFGERLFNVPVDLGYYEKPLKKEDLNNIPHPFL